MHAPTTLLVTRPLFGDLISYLKDGKACPGLLTATLLKLVNITIEVDAEDKSGELPSPDFRPPA